MIRLYVDENIHSAALVDALRRDGLDCLTVNEAGLRGARDEEHLQFATIDERIVYTCDVKDVQRLDREWRIARMHHRGIILLTEPRADIGLQLRCMRTLASRLGDTPMVDRLEFLLNYR